MTADCPICGYQNVSFRARVGFYQADGEVIGARLLGNSEIYCKECDQFFTPGNDLKFPDISIDVEHAKGKSNISNRR